VAAYTAGCPAVSGPSGGGGSVGSWKRGPATSPEPALLEPSTVSQRRRPPPLDEPEPPAERGVLCPSLSSGDMGESGGRPSSDDVWIEGAGVVVRCLSVKTSLGPSSSLSVRPSGVPGRLGAGLSPATLPVGERGFGDGGRVCGDVTNLQKLAMAGKQMRRMIHHQRLSGVLQKSGRTSVGVLGRRRHRVERKNVADLCDATVLITSVTAKNKARCTATDHHKLEDGPASARTAR
jgi:hypothetical protein